MGSKKLNIHTELSIKWYAKWIKPFPIKKILYPDMYILDLEKIIKTFGT